MELEEFCQHHNISLDQGEYLSRGGKNIRCVCGQFKKIITQKQSKINLALYKCCGDTKCEPNFNKKRPAHSKFMKNLALSKTNEKYTSTLMKKGELFNKKVNSDEFKIKILMKNRSYNPNEDIKTQYSRYLSNRMNLKSTRIKMILDFNKKHDIVGLNKKQLEALSDDEFLIQFYNYKSKHHEIYCKDKCGAKHFKRSLLLSLKYNIRGLTSVYTKSSYETNYINYFEKNQIPWDYEFEKFKLDTCSYTPDFLIEYDKKKYIIETKGFLLNEESYFENKILPLKNIVSKYGIVLVFTYQSSPPKDLNQFLERYKV